MEAPGRAALGAYYTPAALAAEVAALAVRARGPVLDPACGDGALLCAAAERLLALGDTPAEAAARLTGVDRNEAALAAARERLRARLGDAAARARLVRADFLLEQGPPGPFAAVVANPPFLSVKRAHLSPEVRAELREKFALARGQFDTCALFAEKALPLLSEGGRWAFVLPRPVLGNESAEPLRRFLLEQGSLDRAVAAGAPFDAAVEVVVLAGARGLSRAVEWGARVEAALLRDGPCASLPIGASEEELRWRAAALAGRRVRDVFAIARGVEAGKRDPAVGQAGVPLLTGEDLTLAGLAAPTRAIDPHAPAARAKAHLFHGPKLLARRVAPRPLAAVDVSDAYALNTLYVLRGDVPLEPAAAALSCDAMGRLYELCFVGGDALFPYVRAAQLGALPLPELRGLTRANADERVRALGQRNR